MCVSRKVYVAYAVSHGPAYVVFRQVMLACRCDSQWHRSVLYVTTHGLGWEQHASCILVVVHGSRMYVLAVVITNTQPLSFDQY